jgi:hypothetical protein
MILYRNGFGLYDQEDLAVKFGVKIDTKEAAAFSVAMPIMTKGNFDEGIQTVESERQINKFFIDNAINLKAKSYKLSSIPSLINFLNEHINANHDIMIEYHSNEIHAEDKYHGNYVHDGLIEGLNLSEEIATVIDPEPEHRQHLYIHLKTIEKSISKTYGRETGFIVVEKVPSSHQVS